jgi:hypothetical protein
VSELERPSAFVSRCLTTLEEYQRLRFRGMSHDMALLQSGFREAVMGRPVNAKPDFDPRAAAAGDREP